MTALLEMHDRRVAFSGFEGQCGGHGVRGLVCRVERQNSVEVHRRLIALQLVRHFRRAFESDEHFRTDAQSAIEAVQTLGGPAEASKGDALGRPKLRISRIAAEEWSERL